MNNQQERLLGYLGGIIDGEGCITFAAPKRGKYIQYTPRVTVVMCNKEVIDYLHWIAGELDLPSYYTTRKTAYEWSIRGLKRCTRFLPRIKPYVVGKRQQVDLVLDWIGSRLTKDRFNTPYSQYELDIVGAVWRANDRETNPVALVKLKESSEAIRQRS